MYNITINYKNVAGRVDRLKKELNFEFLYYNDLIGSRIIFRKKRMVALDSEDQKLYKKMICKILLKKIFFLKISNLAT